MSISVLAFAILIPIPFCVLRRRKYNLSWLQLIVIYITVSTVGAIGACVGSFMSGDSIWGIRLYGLVIFDSIALLLGRYIFHYRVGEMGDFISVPIMMVCCSAKIHCLIKDCCYGFILYTPESLQPVRFPSQILEGVIWAIMALYLLFLEKRNLAKNIMWPVSMIWFGVLRYLVDFCRGGIKEFFFAYMTGGQFWSLVVMLFGLIWLFIAVRQKLQHRPKFAEYCKAIVGFM